MFCFKIKFEMHLKDQWSLNAIMEAFNTKQLTLDKKPRWKVMDTPSKTDMATENHHILLKNEIHLPTVNMSVVMLVFRGNISLMDEISVMKSQ